MTGHGRGDAVHQGYKVAVEISAVNRKQLEVFVNLPREFERLESVVRERAQKKVSRGRVTIRVSVESAQGGDIARVVINRELARESVKELRAIAEECGLGQDLSVDGLMRVPGLVRVESGVEDADDIAPALQRATDGALREFGAMRQAEGQQLAKDLTERIGLMAKAVGRVTKLAPKVLERYRRQLFERIEQAGVDGLEVDDERLLKEVVLFSDRSDITEELTRLESHFQQFDRLAKSKKPVGRTLDFLAQEMNREVNTIGSKANDTEISKEVVLLKTELEKFREQVQNVE